MTEITKRWIKALRSGDFPQGSGIHMAFFDSDGVLKYNTLGVLGHVMHEMVGGMPPGLYMDADKTKWKKFDFTIMDLPIDPDKKVEISGPLLEKPYEDYFYQAVDTLSLNGVSFEQIVDFIEKVAETEDMVKWELT